MSVKRVEMYKAIRAGVSEESPGGPKLTASELGVADSAAESLGKDDRLLAWREIIAEVGEKFDPDFLKKIMEQVGKVEKPFEENGYHAYDTAQIPSSWATGVLLKGEIELGARKLGIKDAIQSQVDEEAAGLEVLLSVVDSVRTQAEADLVAKGWVRVAKKLEGKETFDVGDEGVASLESVLADFRLDKNADKYAVDKYVAKLAGGVAQSGMDEAALKAAVAEQLARPETKEILFDARNMRSPAYQKFVDRMMEHPLTELIKKELMDALKTWEDEQRALQSFGGAFLSKNRKGTKAYPWGDALYKLGQEAKDKMGVFREAEELEMFVESDVFPNAYVYTADKKRPRVTVFTSLVELCWDDEKKGWLTLFLDKNNKPFDQDGNLLTKDSPGATEVEVGKNIMESVILHELSHINDQAIFLSFLWQILFFEAGVEVPSEKHVAANEKQLKLRETLIGKAKAFLDDPKFVDKYGKMKELNPYDRNNPGLPLQQVEELMPRVRDVLERAGITKEAAFEMLTDITDVQSVLNNPPDSLRKMMMFDDFLGMLIAFFMQFYRLSRMMEQTADNGSFVAHGTNLWAATADMLLTNQTNFNAIRDKKAAIAAMMDLGPESFVEDGHEQFAALEATHQYVQDLFICVSHPPGWSRVQLGQMTVQDKDSYLNQLAKLKEIKDPVEQIMATLQLYQHMANTFHKGIDAFAHRKADATVDVVANTAGLRRAKVWEAGATPILGVMDQIVTDDMLLAAESKVYDNIIKFVRDGGLKPWDGTPMVMALGHLKDRLSELSNKDNLSATEKERVKERLESVTSMYDSAKDRQVQLFEGNKKEKDVAEKLKDLLDALQKPQPGGGKPGDPPPTSGDAGGK